MWLCFDAVFSRGWADALMDTLREIFLVGQTNAKDLCVGTERRQRLLLSISRQGILVVLETGKKKNS